MTRAEAGQQKRLLLLDRTAGWEAAEELPLDLGPRFFAAAAKPAAAPAPPPIAPEAAEQPVPASVAAVAAAGEAELAGAAAECEAKTAAAAAAAPQPAGAIFELQLPEGLRAGDRLLLTLPAAAAKQHQKRLRKLERQGETAEGGTAGFHPVSGLRCRSGAALAFWAGMECPFTLRSTGPALVCTHQPPGIPRCAVRASLQALRGKVCTPHSSPFPALSFSC